MNEAEAAGLTVEQLTEEQLAKLMMSLGPSAMIVTRGSRGAGVYTADKKKVIHTELPGIPTEAERRSGTPDTAGCGDVFGAACLFRYTQTPDIVEAARFANRVAARKAAIIRSADLVALAGRGTDLSE
jgi:sugar/nucleoside kinase (ribokinase family)